jgi:hypothetical protein
MKMERTECSETLAFKLQTAGNNPKENIRNGQHVNQSPSPNRDDSTLDIRDGLKHGDVQTPLLFYLVMKLVVSKVTADRNDKLQYTLIQVAVYADGTV